MNLEQAVHRLMSGATLERPKSWPEETYRGWGASKVMQPYKVNLDQACWESIVMSEEFADNERVAAVFATGKPDDIKAVRKAIATRYAEIWLEDMIEQAREPSGESEADENRRMFIATERRAINRDIGMAA